MSRLGIRKLISHYLNSNDRHRMINSNSSQPRETSGFHGTESRPSVIAEVPATQKATASKACITNNFLLGKNQKNFNLCADLNRKFPVIAPMESKKPELLRYLGGGCKLCAVCRQEKVFPGQNKNGICATCHAKIQGALENFKRQQQQQQPQRAGGERLKGALDRPCTMGCTCQEEQRKKQRHQRTTEREREKSGQQQSQPFSIIVLQDCNNNNLIDQLTAALTVGCQEGNTFNGHPQSMGCACSGQSGYHRNGSDVQHRPETVECTCHCPACRTGFENTLKLPMLMAQALELFLSKNGVAVKKSKSDMMKASSASLQSKDKKRKGTLGAFESSTSVQNKKTKGKKRNKNKSKDMPGSQPGKGKGAKSDKAKGGKSQPQSKNLSRSQSNVSFKQRSHDKLRGEKSKDSFKHKDKRRKDEKHDGQPKFFLPPKNRNQSCIEGCRAACSSPRRTECVSGCQGPDGNCTRFTGGCRQGNLLGGHPCSSPTVNKANKPMDLNVGAGDEPNRLHCSRSYLPCQGCNPGCYLGCSSCGHFPFRSARESMHPIAHFRPGVNLYPANCAFYRNGDFVRRSLARTAAGVTLHEVQRTAQVERERELEPKQQMTSQNLNLNPNFSANLNPNLNPNQSYPTPFPNCGSNFQFWR